MLSMKIFFILDTFIMTSPFVVFIYGPPACGKHTIGSILSEKTNLPLFHNHLAVDVSLSLFEFGSDEFISLREEIWLSVFTKAANAGKSFIFTFNPENTVDADLIKKLEECYTSRNGQFFYVEVTCSEEELLNRLGNDTRKKFGKMTDTTLYKTVKDSGGFDFPELPKQFQIDSEKFSASTAANKIFEQIKHLI